MADLITIADYKTAANETGTDKDAQITAALPRASAAIRTYTGRNFGSSPVTEARTFQYDGSGFLNIDDATSVTQVKLNGTVLPATAYLLGPDRGLRVPGGSAVYEWIELAPAQGLSPEMGFMYNLDTLWPKLLRPASVEVTGTFGWSTVPPEVAQAAVWTVASFIADESNYTSQSIDSYSYTIPTLAAEAIPRRAKDLLAPYRRYIT